MIERDDEHLEEGYSVYDNLVHDNLIPKNWVCLVCGKRSLVWGVGYGECQCTVCHAPYLVYDTSKSMLVNPPACRIKSEWLPIVALYYSENEHASVRDIPYKTLMDMWGEFYGNEPS